MRARSFSHVGITVKNFNEFVRFYWDVFGCPLVGVSDQPPDRVQAFFGVQPPVLSDADSAHGVSGVEGMPSCKTGWIRCPGGAVLEIFEFQPQQPIVNGPWNRVGLTHFSLNVRNTQKWHDYLVSKGVEIVAKPERSPRGHTFFFARDCDGNLIELMDLGRMHHVLGLLGPLGGFLFRRGIVQDYRKYYEPRT